MSKASEPGSLYWNLIEPHWDLLNVAWDASVKTFLVRMGAAPLKVQLLYAAHWCQSEVNNGGFYQFFYNTSGILAPEAQHGFTALGLHECAAALADAMKYFGPHYPRARDVRLDKLPEQDGPRATWDPFEPQDERFYASLSERYTWDHAADDYASNA